MLSLQASMLSLQACVLKGQSGIGSLQQHRRKRWALVTWENGVPLGSTTVNTYPRMYINYCTHVETERTLGWWDRSACMHACMEAFACISCVLTLISLASCSASASSLSNFANWMSNSALCCEASSLAWASWWPNRALWSPASSFSSRSKAASPFRRSKACDARPGTIANRVPNPWSRIPTFLNCTCGPAENRYSYTQQPHARTHLFCSSRSHGG